MAISYVMSTWSLDIIFVNNLWMFSCENLQTDRKYEQSYSIIELINTYKIFNVY